MQAMIEKPNKKCFVWTEEPRRQEQIQYIKKPLKNKNIEYFVYITNMRSYVFDFSRCFYIGHF